MEAINEQIINAIEATNATVDQLVQQGNELCDDVDNLRAEDERLGKEVEAIRASVAADKEHISANKEAIASQAKDLAELRSAVADLRSGLANDVVNLSLELTDLRAIVEAQAKEIAELRATAQAPSTPAAPAASDMAALIARIPKPDAVRTRATAQTAAPVVEAVVESAAPSKPRKDAAKLAPASKTITNAVETRAYARQYMIENGAKVEQLRDPSAIEATVASEDFAAWLAER